METKMEDLHLLERRAEINKKHARLVQEQSKELEMFMMLVTDEHQDLSLTRSKEMST